MANFSESTIDQVWRKLNSVSGYNPDIWKKDFAGAWICRDYYGMMGQYGWEIDHLLPVSQGGTDAIENLNALQWQNNRSKGDDFPTFKTTIKADGNHNVECVQSWRVS